MPVDSAADFAEALRAARILEPAQLEEIAGTLQARFPAPRALARELLQRGWLTPYQANQLLQGRGHELLLGSYVLQQRLGEGGMGAVFKARNWKLGTTLALKIIRKERLANPDAVRRFQREIRAAAQLNHPNIVHAYDADEVAGTHFLAMEYVEGTDLQRLVKEGGALPVGQACDSVRQAALGLQHAHERGLVHRDVKPANLLLTTGGVVKVLDLGLARLTEASEDGDGPTTVTREGAVMGTPDYLAPEQALSAHEADSRADLYSLGCTLYFLLTGRVPFPRGSLMEKLLKHRLEEPQPIEALRPGVPPAVTAIVRRLMAKKPEERFQTAAEAADMLAGWAEELNGADLATVTTPVSGTGLPGPGSASSTSLSATGGAAGNTAPPGSHPPPTLPDPTAGPAVEENPFALFEETEVMTRPRGPRRGTARRGWLIAGGLLGVLALAGLVLGLLRPWLGAEEEQPPGPAVKPAVGKPSREEAMPPEPVHQGWLDAVARLPARKQVEAVAAKLKDLNPGFDGRLQPSYANGVVTGLELLTDHVTGLDPVRGLPGLKTLHCRGSAAKAGQLTDLSGLKGLRLTTLACPNNPGVADLTPLKGMPLASLDCSGTGVADLIPLKDMPLTDLDCGATKANDLTPLKALPLKRLRCNATPVADLAPLRGRPLEWLDCSATGVLHLTPLAQLPLVELDCAGSPVASLAALKSIRGLKALGCDFSRWRGDAAILRTLPALEKINGLPPAAFFKKVDAEAAAFDAWVASVRKLPAAKQADALAAELKKRNPGFDGKVKPTVEKGVVTGLALVTDRVTDLSPVRALPGLKTLDCSGSNVEKGKLFDLSPLKGLSLTTLYCNFTQVADLTPLAGMKLTKLTCSRAPVSTLSPLKGMPLAYLQLHGNLVADLTPLKGMPLKYLSLSGCPVTSLAPLKGMPLTTLSIYGTPVADLAPLQGMKLTTLDCFSTKVANLAPLTGMPLANLDCHSTPVGDLAPLKGMPLKALVCNQTHVTDFSPLAATPLQTLTAALNPWRDAKVLRTLKGLQKINDRPAAAFWAPLEAFEAWAKTVRPLPPDRQVAAVAAELKKRNPGFDGKLTPKKEGAVVTELSLPADKITDLAPVRALPALKSLTCNAATQSQARLSDLSPLHDMKLTHLEVRNTQVADLAPLRGMPLTSLECTHTPIADLTPLKGMPLKVLSGYGMKITNLAPLKGLPLQKLMVGGSAVVDLTPLKGMALTHLDVRNTRVADLAPLLGMRLTSLDCRVTAVADLWPLAGMPLVSLNCSQTQVTDFSPLKGMGLKALQATLNPWRDAAALRTLKTLQTINDKPAAAFYKPLEDFEAWAKTVRALPPAKQLDAVSAELKKRNPGFDGKVTPKKEGGAVTGLEFAADKVTDLAPLRELGRLKALDCAGSASGKSKLSDLWPLKDLKLTTLRCGNTPVADLAPLKGMPLTRLECAGTAVADLEALRGMKLTLLAIGGTKVSDLGPLRGMPLTSLNCHNTGSVADLEPLRGMKLTFLSIAGTKVADLEPLGGMPLAVLWCHATPVTTLAPLRGMPLTELSCHSTGVSDLSPLSGMPLKRLSCALTKVTDLTPLKGLPLQELECDAGLLPKAVFLRSLKSLQKINGKPAAQFWK